MDVERAVAVVRISQVGDRDGESFHSPEDQRDRIQKLCAGHGWQVDIYPPELNVSGGAPLEDRPQLSRAVMAVQTGTAKIIAAAWPDRLFRSVEVRNQVVRIVEAAGGEVWTPEGRITNGTAGQKFVGTVVAAADEHVKDQAREKSRDAVAKAIASGVIPWGSIVPGYRKRSDGRYEPDPILAPAVAEAVKMRADGATIPEVREHLRRHGLERSHHGITSLLGSRVLLGEIHFGSYQPNLEAHQPIVDRDIWEQAQRVRSLRGRKPKSDRILARLGVLRCSNCGARMVTATSNNSKYAVYRCPPTGDCLKRVSISAEVVEHVVVEAARLGVEGFVGRRAAQDRIRSARLVLEQAQADLDSAIRTLADFTDEPATVERLRTLRERRDQARDRIDRLGSPDGDDTWLLLSHDWDRLSVADQRRCIRATISRVLVRPAEAGVRPHERVEVVPHSIADWFAYRTPPVPTDLS